MANTIPLNVHERLLEIQQNTQLIDRLTRNNTLLMDSVIRDTALESMTKHLGIGEDVRGQILAIMNGQIESPSPRVARPYPQSTIVPAITGPENTEASEEPSGRRAARSGATKRAAASEPALPNIGSGTQAEVLVSFTKAHGNTFNFQKFKKVYGKSKRFNEKFWRGPAYALASRLKRQGVLLPIQGDKSNYMLNPRLL